MGEQPRKKASGSLISKIVAIILCIVLIPMLIVNITLIVKSFANPNEVPSFMGYKPFIVLSGSMEPVFYSGDLALVREADPDNLKQGDIIAFREGESVVTHRIKEITSADGQRRFITKGDNNNVEDKITVTDDKLEGIFILKVAGLGNTAMFMQTSVGMVVFIAIPLILFILYDVCRRRIYDRKERVRTKELEEELERIKQQIAQKGEDGDSKPE